MAKKEAAAPVVPDATTETLQLVAAAKGPAVALADLEAHLGQCEKQIKAKVDAYRDGTRSFELTVLDVLVLFGILAAWLAIMARGICR